MLPCHLTESVNIYEPEVTPILHSHSQQRVIDDFTRTRTRDSADNQDVRLRHFIFSDGDCVLYAEHVSTPALTLASSIIAPSDCMPYTTVLDTFS